MIDKVKKSEQDRKYREKNKEALKEKKRQYYLANKEKINEKAKKNYEENKDSYKERAKQWKLDNSARHNAACMDRYTRKMKARPKWLSPIQLVQIQEFYEIAKAKSFQTGITHHVDHIIPLKNSTVSGLHVPWNLQILTESENCSKKNNVIV
jgi:5-methylcytosine-specific restriction endonuclease McrA